MKKRTFGPPDFPNFPDFPFDEDFSEEFNRIEEMMRGMLESHLKTLGNMEPGKGLQPRVYGFTLEFGPEGKAKLTEFGNPQSQPLGARAGVGSRLKPAPAGQLQGQGVPRTREKGEPFVDVINNDDSVSVIAELPGVVEEHLDLKVFPRQLSIRVSDPQRFFSKTIALPAEVIASSLKSTLKNGILEIVFKKKKN